MTDHQLKVRSFSKERGHFKPRVPWLLKIVGLKNLIWIGVVAGCALILNIFGTPHVLFEYRYTGSKDHKTDCTYVGLNSQTVSARDGECAIVTLLRHQP